MSGSDASEILTDTGSASCLRVYFNVRLVDEVASLKLDNLYSSTLGLTNGDLLDSSK